MTEQKDSNAVVQEFFGFDPPSNVPNAQELAAMSIQGPERGILDRNGTPLAAPPFKKM